ncbi:hypothetical protein FOZ61_009670, partial [Perkinsus olseni]
MQTIIGIVSFICSSAAAWNLAVQESPRGSVKVDPQFGALKEEGHAYEKPVGKCSLDKKTGEVIDCECYTDHVYYTHDGKGDIILVVCANACKSVWDCPDASPKTRTPECPVKVKLCLQNCVLDA